MCDTFKLSQLSRVEMKPCVEKPTAERELVTYFEGKTQHWACDDAAELSNFVGCLASSSKETLRKSLTVVGEDTSVIEEWASAYKAKSINSGGGAKFSLIDETDGKKEEENSPKSRIGEEDLEEEDLRKYLETHRIEMGDHAKAFETRVRDEFSNLDHATVWDLMERSKQAGPIKEELDAVERNLEDVEAWLDTFSVKLLSMKEDARVIEDLLSLKDEEKGPRKNEVLTKVMTELIEKITVPEGLEEKIHNSAFETDDDIADVVKAIDEVCAFRKRFEEDEMKIYRRIRSVAVQEAKCMNLCDELIGKSTYHLKSLLEGAVERELDLGIKSDAKGMPCAPTWERIHVLVNQNGNLMRAMHRLHGKSTG
ncbi:uncharacterized protein MICPUCDRAFT_52706 [Micromonas pusilla CCMP1545]|jgi:hypothetical protein|uniref:Predicted protein n=1 Tax=Micromonas pusilla (strain CCMP1545) TaxID=564608 RepID=C1N4W7_MICPC|nr:uncharacterized protein MICPUCDRAFT_52706 [Micromonas pusilla CCMP1545]EEH53007.1 predicted protein [Micromonas pusilla CCMP1545]|tara:strand:+ start:1472 stop:2575 length:1104 start_codon:yes stop_codon:yes gene_type:complete|eukprot:XP_003063068.1 predicted protein [Micromonas pusilla CCMP1545]